MRSSCACAIRRHSSACGVLVVAALVLGPRQQGSAQILGETLHTIAPVYEGFQRNRDGSFNLLFGYFSRDLDQPIDVPIGPHNRIEPGGPDRGQPTHFLQRRNRFVFRVHVPSDFGSKELVWTLTSHGETTQAFGSLRPLYEMDDIAIMANFGGAGSTGFSPDVEGNTPPVLEVGGGKNRTVRAGEPVELRAVATDDGKPRAKSLAAFVGRDRTTPDSATGLRLSWFVYRGVGDVAFDPPQTKVWEDLRDGGNSPWSVGWKTPPVPAGNRWIARVTFGAPGTYVLRCLAHDGALATYEDVTFTVQ